MLYIAPLVRVHFTWERVGTEFPLLRCWRTHCGRHCEPFSDKKCTRLHAFAYRSIFRFDTPDPCISVPSAWTQTPISAWLASPFFLFYETATATGCRRYDGLMWCPCGSGWRGCRRGVITCSGHRICLGPSSSLRRSVSGRQRSSSAAAAATGDGVGQLCFQHHRQPARPRRTAPRVHFAAIFLSHSCQARSLYTLSKFSPFPLDCDIAVNTGGRPWSKIQNGLIEYASNVHMKKSHRSLQ